jgi:hypothetical protein
MVPPGRHTRWRQHSEWVACGAARGAPLPHQEGSASLCKHSNYLHGYLLPGETLAAPMHIMMLTYVRD